MVELEWKPRPSDCKALFFVSVLYSFKSEHWVICYRVTGRGEEERRERFQMGEPG